MRRSLASAVTGILALSATAVVAVATASPATAAAGGSYNGLALTPPMGFNDWNAYHCNVSADLIEQTALAMHNNGMQAAGYDYVDIDDCWILGRDASEIPPGQTKASVGRGADGHLIVDPNYFPSSAPGLNDGIKLVADYVHSLGMKLGIYEDTGTATCQGLAGTYKGPNGATWDAIDAQDFADWGVDFLKDDWCNVPLADVPGATRDDKANYLYTQMSQALAATGKPIVFEAATLGDSNLHTYTWAPAVSNFWRTTSDISASFSSMLRNFTTNSTLAQYAGPGHWNDPDMLEIGTGSTTTLAAPVTPGDTIVKVASTSGALVGAPIRFGTTASGDLEGGIISAVGTAGATGTGLTLTAPLVLAHPSGEAVGKTGMTLAEEQSHLSLWAEEAAPLIAGTNLVDIAPQNLAVYLNREVIAVDQDALGVQARVVSNANSQWLLDRPLSDGAHAVVLFNAGSTPWTDATVALDSLGLDPSQRYASRDLWAHTDTTVNGTIDVGTIAPHATMMLKVSSAANLLTDQLALVGNANGGSFADQLLAASAAVEGDQPTSACEPLTGYTNHVRAQSGKKLSGELADELLANAQLIGSLLGC